MKKQLNFSSKLYGRSSELDTLQNAYNQVGDSTQVALLHGFSGTGKSALVLKWKKTLLQGEYFCFGKFGKLRMSEPYSALATALTELCDMILDSSNKNKIIASFQETVGSKGRVLFQLVPRIRLLIDADNTSTKEDEEFNNTSTALNQLKFVFRAFCASICAMSTVVMFLDDLQWADAASLEIIEAMVNDSKLKNLLFIGAYRDHKVIDTDSIPAELRGIAKGPHVTMIQLGNLSVELVNQLIADVTELDVTSTQSLADVVHRKTNGNVFFVIQFLKMLQDEGLLVFSMTRYKWTWDADRVQSGTDLADNVVDLMAAKILKLPVKAQSVLKLAACVWTTFDAEILKTIIAHGINMHNEQCKTILVSGKKTGMQVYNNLFRSILSVGEDELVDVLDLAVEEGLLDKIHHSSRYKFGHDRIQQAAYLLVPEGRERDLLHYWIGELILQMTKSPAQVEEWMFFVAAEQLNRGSAFVTDKNERRELAQLNLIVGQKAIALSAFEPAAKYLKSGFNILEEEQRWDQYYDLTLQFSNTLADTEVCIGNHEEAREYVQEVVAHAHTLQEKVPAYNALGLSLFSQGKQHDFFDLCFELLDQLGEPISKHAGKPQQKREYLKLKRMLRGRTDKDLLNLPLMKDESKLTAMRLLFLNAVSRFHLGMIGHAALLAMQMVRLSLQYGNCSRSPFAYTIWGMCNVQYDGNLDEGSRYGKLGLQLNEKWFCGIGDTSAVVFAANFLYHWKEPLTNCLPPFLDAYKIAMRHGDITMASQSVLGYQTLYYFTGLPLAPIVEDMKAYSQQMLEYKQEFIHRAAGPLLQCMLNLMGCSKDPLVLTGEVMSQEEYENEKTNPKRVGVQAIASCRMQLAYYFGDFELAAMLSKELQKQMETTFIAHYLMCQRITFFGLISAALARKTKRRKHFVGLRKTIAHVEKRWVKCGAINCVHKLFLLKAEDAAIKNRCTQKVKEAYDAAISTSRRAGFSQDEALANEKAGEYFLQGGDEVSASSYMSRAYELYLEWGAKAKADQLKAQHGSLLTQHIGPGESSGLSGKQKFSDKETKTHKRISNGGLFKESQ